MMQEYLESVLDYFAKLFIFPKSRIQKYFMFLFIGLSFQLGPIQNCLIQTLSKLMLSNFFYFIVLFRSHLSFEYTVIGEFSIVLQFLFENFLS